MSRRLLLLSNSRNPGEEFLEHSKEPLEKTLSDAKNIVFIPYAGVTLPFTPYTELVRELLASLGYSIQSVHEVDQPKVAVAEADAIIVGGGNTFHLLHHLSRADLIDTIRDRVESGIPYVGWSAGSNIACPTIMTTNDMPIIAPPSLDALGLVPFQINPHYLDHSPKNHGGETREQRILEFIEVNPGVSVLGLREGTMLNIEDQSIALIGDKSMRLFKKGEETKEIQPGDPIDFLLS